MHQSIAVSVCLLLLAVCSGAQSPKKRMTGTDSDAIGLAAERFLLKGSTLLQADSPRSMLYRRPGGPYTAASDFYALKPTKLVHLNEIADIEIYGRVGKRAIIFTMGKDMWPQISITRFEPGKNPHYNYYMKVFWYMGDAFDGHKEV